MAKIISASINLTAIPKEAIIESKGKKYLNLQIILNDQKDNYGNDVSISLNQTKEQREAKEKKTFIGNGKVVWSNDADKSAPSKETKDDLPF